MGVGSWRARGGRPRDRAPPWVESVDSRISLKDVARGKPPVAAVVPAVPGALRVLWDPGELRQREDVGRCVEKAWRSGCVGARPCQSPAGVLGHGGAVSGGESPARATRATWTASRRSITCPDNVPLVPITSRLGRWDHHWFVWLPRHPVYESVEVASRDAPENPFKFVWVFFTERDGAKRQVHYLNNHDVVHAGLAASIEISPMNRAVP